MFMVLFVKVSVARTDANKDRILFCKPNVNRFKNKKAILIAMKWRMM